MISFRQVDFLARTWAERGVRIPFTTPDLTRARMRRDEKNRREFVLPNLSGGRGCYVMAWSAIRASMPVSMHDRLLVDLLEKYEAETPIPVYWVTQRAAASGLAGPAAARRAKETLAQQRQYQVLTTFTLVLNLLRMADIPGPDYLAEGLQSPEVQAHMREALRQIGEGIGLPHDALYTRIEVLAGLVAPLGVKGAVMPGRLRTLLDGLEEFRSEAARWVDVCPGEVAALAAFEADAARFVCETGAIQIARVDRLLEDVIDILAAWDTRGEEVSAAVREMSWLFDGWDLLLRHYRSLPLDSVEDRWAAAAELYPLTPIIPSSVMGGISEQRLDELAVIQRRRVPAHADWRTGMVDLDHMRRMEGRRG